MAVIDNETLGMFDHGIVIKLPDHIFSDVTQNLRDDIADWLESNRLDEDDYESFYCVSNAAPTKELSTGQSLYSHKYICYCFKDSNIAVLFKLTFG